MEIGTPSLPFADGVSVHRKAARVRRAGEANSVGVKSETGFPSTQEKGWEVTVGWETREEKGGRLSNPPSLPPDSPKGTWQG